MLYQEFYQTWFAQGCFTSNQVYAWKKGFDKNNLGRWVRNGLLIKLRNGFYSFPEYLNKPNSGLFVANRIYLPSYISLYTALGFYGLIPEAIVKYTSISTLKTNEFKNEFGTFQYKHIKTKGFFGYEALPFNENKSILIAKAEKAMLDLLYLNPFYSSENDMVELRLDQGVLTDMINKDTLIEFAEKFENLSLVSRVYTLIKVYEI